MKYLDTMTEVAWVAVPIEVRCFTAGSLIGFTAMPKRPSDQLAIKGVRSGYHNATEAGYNIKTQPCSAFHATDTGHKRVI